MVGQWPPSTNGNKPLTKAHQLLPTTGMSSTNGPNHCQPLSINLTNYITIVYPVLEDVPHYII